MIVHADLSREDHARDVQALTAAYAEDPMGAGQPLPPDVLSRLVPALRAHPTTLIVLAYESGRPVGLATSFLGFSTFAARPLLNLHDLAVLPTHRGRGVGRALLEAVERKARELGCAKVTLEVGDQNLRARALYEAVGFHQAMIGAGAGSALFYAKVLTP